MKRKIIFWIGAALFICVPLALTLGLMIGGIK